MGQNDISVKVIAGHSFCGENGTLSSEPPLPAPQSKREYISDRASVETLSSANAAGRIQRQHVSEEFSPEETLENVMSLQAGDYF